MRKFMARLLGVVMSRCTSKCPQCGDTCIAGVHGTGGHFCSKGHTW
ncbi:MAG: hypothetical protein ACJ8GK_10245 [Luteimonas sp.]